MCARVCVLTVQVPVVLSRWCNFTDLTEANEMDERLELAMDERLELAALIVDSW